MLAVDLTDSGLNDKLDTAGNTPNAGDRALLPIAGTNALLGPYVYSGTAWALDPAFTIVAGATVHVIYGTSGSTDWEQTAKSGAAVFVPVRKDRVYFGPPIDGTSDDAPALQAVMNAEAAGLGRQICFLPSAVKYCIKSLINCPNGTRVLGNPGVRVKFDMPPGPNTSSLFYAAWISGGGPDNSQVVPVWSTGIPVGSALTGLTVGAHVVVGGGAQENWCQRNIVAIGRGGSKNVAGTIPLALLDLYGVSGLLAAATIILNVNGGGNSTLILTGGVATAAALIAAINGHTGWTGIASNNNGYLQISAGTSIALGSGTANAILGLTTDYVAYVDEPIPFAMGVSAGQMCVSNTQASNTSAH